MNTKKNWVTSFLSPFIGSADEIDTATSAGTQLQVKKKTCGRELLTAGLRYFDKKDISPKCGQKSHQYKNVLTNKIFMEIVV